MVPRRLGKVHARRVAGRRRLLFRSARHPVTDLRAGNWPRQYAPTLLPDDFRIVAARIPTFPLTHTAALGRRRFTAAWLCFLQFAASGAALWFVTPDDRPIVAPMLAIAWTATVYLLTLWARDGSLPLF